MMHRKVSILQTNAFDLRIDSASHLSNPEMITIRFQVEPERYEAAISWLRDLLWDGVFDVTVGLFHDNVEHHPKMIKSRDSRRQLQGF